MPWLAFLAVEGYHSMNRVSKSVHIATLVVLSLIGLPGITNAQIDVRVSGPSPFKPGCDRSGSPAVNYENAEVEPWLAIDPNDADHLVGIWQQDRWRQLAGSHGLMTGVSHDGGLTWQRTFAHFSRCAGGNSTNGGDYERASDPWGHDFSQRKNIRERRCLQHLKRERGDFGQSVHEWRHDME
jgi:hypothetical protein